MSGFTTNSLLYPLSKGEASGHPFRGNQYKTGETGEQKTTTKRPAVGKFQLTKDEAQELVDIMGDTNRGDKEAQKAMVRLAQMLGMDKPAERVTKAPTGEPDLYRGCDKAGADSLSKPLEMYNKGKGTAYGEGVYFAPSDEEGFDGLATAQEYADAQDGQVVSAWINPNAKILDLTTSDSDMGAVVEQMRNQIDSLGLESHENPDLPGYQAGDAHTLKVLLMEPANVALALGYQAVKLYGVTVVLDRSILKVKY